MGAKKIALRERDLMITKFLDRVGYANIKHVTRAVGGDEKSESGVLQRLYMLKRFGYVKTLSTHMGTYFALDRKGRGENALIVSIKLDQLLHHDFLTELYFFVENRVPVLSERECITRFKIVGKKGKIPDMVIDDWIIEFERTNKSVVDSKAVVDYWTVEQSRALCIIYESDEIKNRYSALLNPRVRLLAKTDYQSILDVLLANKDTKSSVAEVDNFSGNESGIPSAIDDAYVATLKNKYM